MFQLFDKENKGLSIESFRELSESLGIYLSKEQLALFFQRASKDNKFINFHDFVEKMEKKPEEIGAEVISPTKQKSSTRRGTIKK